MSSNGILLRKVPVIAIWPVLLAVAFVAAAGGDPWKSKPYQQWDSKDIHRILSDSPWARIVRVSAPWRGRKPAASQSPSQPSSQPPGTASSSGMSPGSYGSNTARAPRAGNEGDEAGEESGTAQAAFLVRWNSSRVVREAALRDAILAGKMKESDADRLLAQPAPVYDVFVTGHDMAPFAGADEKELKSHAFLVTRKSRKSIPAAAVQIIRGQDGTSVIALLFSFPRKEPDGEPGIAPDEKGVEFQLTQGDLSLRFTFEPQKMADSQGMDL
jgi:hypothetical protein